MESRCHRLPALLVAWASYRARLPLMIYGLSRRRLPVRVATSAILNISTSARKNSTASPCSCRASEKAESSFSVRAEYRILPLTSAFAFLLSVLTHNHSTEACHTTPRRHRAPSRAHTTRAWRRGLGSRYLPKPTARGIPRRSAHAPFPTLWGPWGPSAGASRRPDSPGYGR